MVVIIAVLLALWGAVLIMGVSAAGGKQIYPNVKVNGHLVGRMTEKQAVKALSETVDNYSDKFITVKFPDGQSLEMTTTQAGLSPEADEAAEMAYNYGRDGNIFTNALKYIKCLIGLGVVDINREVVLALDEEGLRSAVAQAAKDLNSQRIDPSHEVVEDKLLINLGKSGMAIDENELYNLLSEAFLKSDFEDIEYDANMDPAPEVDIQSIYDSVHTEPENSVYDRESGTVTQDKQGISFDMDEVQRLVAGASGGEQVEIPLVFTGAEITSEDLKSLLFVSQLSAKSTELTNNSNRNNNIELAANVINGYVINPGEQFSFNDVVGQRTTAKGYLEAGAYSGGQSVNEVGGGICQVSSTIYYTVLKADLEVVNRSAHTFTVSYLPLGMDAAVSWGGPEFAFRNNTPYPIKVMARREGLALTIELYGTKTNDYTIELDSVTTNTINYETEYVDDSSLPAGTTSVKTAGRTGYTAVTYRYVYDGNGNLIREEQVNTSSYSKLNQVVLRGTG